MAPPAPAPCILLTQGPRSSQLQIQGFGVTYCGLALKSADPRAPQGDTSPSNCLAQGSSALQTPPTLLRAQEVWGRPSRHQAGGVRSPSPGLCAFQTCVSGSVYPCPWRRHPRTRDRRSGGPHFISAALRAAHILPLVAAPIYWPGHLGRSPPTSGRRGAQLVGGWGGQGEPCSGEDGWVRLLGPAVTQSPGLPRGTSPSWLWAGPGSGGWEDG